MEGLRVELGGEGFYALFGHEVGGGGEFLADLHVVEIEKVLGHGFWMQFYGDRAQKGNWGIEHVEMPVN